MQKFALFLFPLLFAACHHDDAPEETTSSERTVLVYMAAENSLSDFANEDLREMKVGSKSLNDRQNLIVYVDQAGATPPYMGRIKNGVLVDSVGMDESLTADPAIMEQVLRRMRTTYPAQEYGLVLWGHANGWLIDNDSVAYAQSRGYGGDNGNGSPNGSGKYWMNIPSMARAIGRGMDGTPLKFVFGDCCNLGCVEVAYELRNVTDYLIASPAEIPDKGAPYHLVTTDLFSRSDGFYQTITDRYYNHYLDEFKNHPDRYYSYVPGDLKGYSVPLSVIRTSEMENLVTATARILSTISDKVSNEGTLELGDVVYYAMYSGYRYSYDMYGAFKRNAARGDFDTWVSAFDKAVPYHVFSGRWLSNFSQLSADMENLNAEQADCGEVSMFFPQLTYRWTSPLWNDAIKHYQWNNVIRWEQYGW